jgi:hypothetical protein
MRNCSTGKGIFLQVRANFNTLSNCLNLMELNRSTGKGKTTIAPNGKKRRFSHVLDTAQLFPSTSYPAQALRRTPKVSGGFTIKVEVVWVPPA